MASIPAILLALLVSSAVGVTEVGAAFVIGWLIDRSAGTSPTFTIMLAVFGVVGTVAKFWLDYDRQMKRHEAEGIWSRKSGASNTGEQQ